MLNTKKVGKTSLGTSKGGVRFASAPSLVGIAVVIAVTSPAAGAQGASGSTEIEEIVVTAQRREERLQDVPVSVSVLDGQQLDRSTSQGITEILRAVPGVTTNVSPQGGGTLITVRGVSAGSPLFDGSSPVAYYLDGVPFGLIDSAIAPDSNAFDLARVEVLRGPQGTLYGASALNGVVRVLTNDADLEGFDFKARGAVSSTDNGGENYRGDIALNAPIVPGRLAVRGVLGYQDLSGWIDRPNDEDANEQQISNFRLRVNAQPSDRLSLGFSAWLSRQDFGAPTISNDEGETGHLVDEESSIDYDTYGMTVGYDFSNFSFTSVTGYLDYRNDNNLDFIDFFGFSTLLEQQLDATVFSQEIILNSTGTGSWRWTAGAIYRDGSNSTVQSLPAFAFTLDWTNESQSYAAFGELTRTFADGQFELTVGARYFRDDVTVEEDQLAPPLVPPDYYQAESDFSDTSPRLVLTWHPNDDVMVYGSYSEGFRSGAPQAYYTTGGISGFPATDPDQLRNYEVGLKANLLDQRISLESAVYYMDWEGVHQTLGVEVSGICCVGALVNGPPASGIGVDFGFAARPFDALELGVNASWNDLTFDTDVISNGTLLFREGDRLNFSPEYTIGAFAGYTIQLTSSGVEGTLSADASYTSAQDWRASSNPFPESDYILNSRASFTIRPSDNWEVMIYADNIANEDGRLYSNPNDLNLANPATASRLRPRTIGVQFDYRY